MPRTPTAEALAAAPAIYRRRSDAFADHGDQPDQAIAAIIDDKTGLPNLLQQLQYAKTAIALWMACGQQMGLAVPEDLLEWAMPLLRDTRLTAVTTTRALLAYEHLSNL